jgi:hypothetical protein
MANRWEKLSEAMVSGASRKLGARWPGLRSYAKPEFEKLAITIDSVADRRKRGSLKHREAVALLDLQRASSRAMLTAHKHVDLVVADDLIEAALGSVRIRGDLLRSGPGTGLPPPGANPGGGRRPRVVKASPAGGKPPPGRGKR